MESCTGENVLRNVRELERLAAGRLDGQGTAGRRDRSRRLRGRGKATGPVGC